MARLALACASQPSVQAAGAPKVDRPVFPDLNVSGNITKALSGGPSLIRLQ